MKNIGMKKNINEQREGIWGESLKSLKSLMRNFAESANSANSAKQIFATFATFAMQIFSNLVNLVKLVMQIFHKGSYSAVRAMSVQQPTNIQRISNLSLTIRPILPLFATVVMLTFGGWSSEAWGNTAKIEQEEFNGNRAWSGHHANFVIAGTDWSTTTVGGDGRKLQLKSGNTYTISWTIEEGYAINVTEVRCKIGAPWTGYDFYFNDIKCGSVGGWGTKDDVYLGGLSLGKDDNIKLRATGTCNIYYLKITYTITPDAPSVSQNTASVNVTLPDAVSHTTIDVASNFATTEHLTSKSYSLTSNPTGAGNLSGSDFYATKAGTYQVKAQYNAEANCHEASGWSSPLTITVDRLTPTLTLSGTTGTVDLTSDVESPNYFDLSSLISTYVGNGRDYLVSSDNSAYGHFSGDNFYATQAGDYTIRISSPQGDQYTGTFSDSETYREVTITVRDKARPSFEMNYSQATADALLVGDTIKNAFTFTNVSNDEDFTFATTAANMAVIKSGSDVITYDATNNWIVARNKGTATLQFVQTETGALYGGSSAVYTFTVSKHTTSFEGSAYNLMVDGTQTADYSYTNTSAAQPTANSSDDFYYTIDDVTFTNSAKNNGTNFVTFNPSNKQIEACNAGTGKITLHQKETYKYTGATKSFDVAVYKYNSVFANVANLNVKVEENVSSAYTLTYTKPNDAYIGADNLSAGIPGLNEASGDFYYTLAQNVTTDVTAGSDQPTWAITYDAASKTATGKNAGTGTIHLYQKETYKYNAADEDFDVNVSKHTTAFTWNSGSAVYYYGAKIYDVFSTTGENAYSFSSTNPYAAEAVKGEKDTLLIKNVNEPATITVTQIENYKWNGKSEPYEVTPVNQTNHVPFTINNENKDIIQSEASTNVSWNGSNTYRLGTGKWGVGDRPDEYVKIGFSGMPDTLYFSINADKSGLGDWAYYPVGGDYAFFVYESATGNNDDWTELDWGFDNSNGFGDAYLGGNDSKRHIKVALSQTTRYIKLRYHGACWGKFENIRVGQLLKFNTDFDALDFGTYGAKYGEQEMLINFNHANAGRVTSAEIVSGVGDFDKFSVSPTTIPGTGRDLYGTTTLGVTFDNGDEVGRETPYTATLRIKDNNGHSKDVTLTGTRWGKTTPVITWNPHHMPYYVGAKIYTVATSTNTDYTHSPLRYETTDADVAEVIDGKLHIHDKKSPVTISVIQDPYGEFNGARLDTTFTPYDKPDLTTPLHLTKAVYDSRSITPSTDQIAWDDPSTNVIRIGNNKGPGGYGYKSFIITFGGVPDVLTFKYKTSTDWSTQSLRMNAPQWHVRESADGKDWTEIWYKADNRESWGTITKQLSPDTRYVEFVYDGNYYGYFADINITALDGIKYMRNGDKYMSRGGGYGTQAVMDEFGVPVRVTRYTKDNDHTHDTTLVQFMDSKQYLYETNGYVYTDNVTGNNTQTRWIQTVVGNTVQVRSANGSGKYITITDGKLMMADDAGAVTSWSVEDYTAHYDAVLKKLDAKAAAAAAVDFGPEMNTLAEVRRQIKDNDFEKAPVDIEHKNDKAYENGDSRPAEGIPTVYENTISVESGFYRLTVKAMYKTAPDPVDWDNKNAGIESVVAYVFANDAYYPIKSRYDESGKYDAELSAGASIQKGGKYYANDAASAHVAFADENAYLNDVYVYVEDKGEGTGTLHYGIKNPSFVPDGSWLAYENFTLTKIARKTYTFGEIGSGDDWDELGNWKYKGEEATAMPTINHAVEIKRNITIAGELKAYSVTIEDDAQVTIDPTGGLTIGVGGVSLGDGAQLILKAETEGANKGQTGYIRISPEYEGAMPQATVEMLCQGYSNAYTKNNFASGTMMWQYLGAPVKLEGTKIKSVVPGWINSWDEVSGEWVNNRSTVTFVPFKGFANSQNFDAAGVLATYSGQLIDNDIHPVDLTHGESEMAGWNLLANSFAAPIDIKKMFEYNDEIADVDETVYIFNASTGTYTPVTKANAGSTVADVDYQGVIPSMQGFFIKANSACTFKFDYTSMVWEADYTDGAENTPMRVNKRYSDEAEKQVVSVTMEANGQTDKVLLIESEEYDIAFENGYDAHYMPVGGFNIFAVEEDDHLAIDATNSIIGTRLGVRTGEETAYTMTFNYVDSENSLLLWDIEADEKIAIREGGMYTFFIEPNSVNTGRFIIIEAEAPEIATGVEEVSENGAKVHKFIKDDKLYILKNGVLYDATGAVVRR